jgi:hypothetical protein
VRGPAAPVPEAGRPCVALPRGAGRSGVGFGVTRAGIGPACVTRTDETGIAAATSAPSGSARVRATRARIRLVGVERAILVAGAVLVAAACAAPDRSGSAARAGAATSPAIGTSRTAATGGPAAGSDDGVRSAPTVPAPAASRAGAASAAGGAQASAPATPSRAPLRVTLGAACVVPGGEQRIVVETLAGAFVAYDNLYPDNRDGQVHGGADGRARSDASGRFTATWRVGADTPTGRVRIDVGASAPGGSAITSAYYRLAASCG